MRKAGRLERWRTPTAVGKSGSGLRSTVNAARQGQSRANASRSRPSKEACTSAGSRCNCSSAARTCASRKPRWRNAEKTLAQTSSACGFTLRPYSLPSACRTRMVWVARGCACAPASGRLVWEDLPALTWASSCMALAGSGEPTCSPRLASGSRSFAGVGLGSGIEPIGEHRWAWALRVSGA